MLSTTAVRAALGKIHLLDSAPHKRHLRMHVWAQCSIHASIPHDTALHAVGEMADIGVAVTASATMVHMAIVRQPNTQVKQIRGAHVLNGNTFVPKERHRRSRVRQGIRFTGIDLVDVIPMPLVKCDPEVMVFWMLMVRYSA